MISHAPSDRTREQLVEEVSTLTAEAEALRERNALLMAVIDGNNDLVFVKDERGRYLLINKAGAKVHGKSADEIIGRDDTELFDPETARRLIEDDRAIVAGDVPRIFEEDVTYSGVLRNFLVTKAPYLAEGNRPAGVIGISRDVTDRKLAEKSLRDTQEFLSRLLELSPVPIYVTTADGRTRMVNRAWEEVVGRRRDEVLGLPLDQVFSLEQARRFREQNRQVVETAAPIAFEEEIEFASSRRTFYTVKFPLRDGSDRVEAIGGISLEITELKRTRASLDESLLRFQALFENTLDAIWLLDDEARFIDANPAVCSLLGYSRDEFLTMGVEDVTPDDGQDLVRHLWKTFLFEGRLTGEFTQLRRDGTIREVDFRAAANILPGVHLSVNRDITLRKQAERELRKSEEQVRLLLDSTSEAIYGVDLDGRCTFCNAACLRLLNYTDPADLIGKSMEDLIRRPPSATGLEWSEPPFEAFRRGVRTLVEDVKLWRSDGSDFPAERRSSPILRGGELVGAAVTCVDLTERRRVEEELLTLNAALENAVEGISRLDSEGRYVTVNPAYAFMLGYQPEELIGRSWQQTVHPRELEKGKAAIQRMSEDGRAEVEILGVRRDGATFWKQNVLVRADDRHGRWAGLFCFMKDITERKQTEESLRDYAERLQVLSRRVVEVQEEERRHLARGLHDEIGQTLTAIGIHLQTIKRSSALANSTSLDECIGMVDGAIAQVRHLALNLRPSILDDLGLVAALRWYLDRQAQLVGYQGLFQSDPDEIQADPTSTITAFRVAQEALTNVARHSRASHVTMRIEVRDGILTLSVFDDGIGFDPDTNLAAGSTAEALGLLGMSERAALVGGKLTIRSAAGWGTEVRLTITLVRGEEV